MRHALALTLIFAAGYCARTSADEAMPVRDVAAACAALADNTAKSGPVSRDVAMNLCLQEEQQGYDAAKLLWGSISAPRRQECLQHAAGLGRANFYRGLGVCLEAKFAVEDNERQMQQLRSKPQGFRY